MKITATPASSLLTGRLVQRIRDEVLSLRAVERLKRGLDHDLGPVSSMERSAALRV